MSTSKCARCDKTVYPVEGLRCLDKIWHKGCFKCHECSMTLNMKNYKGFEKRPYCNAHCPQAKATTVADTPEIRRLAENTRIQSQAKYHEDFEKSKGKNFTTIADDPETRRIKETSKIISNASYHGDIEKKRHMEEKRNSSAQEDVPKTRISSNQNIAVNNISNSSNNNNNIKHQNRMPSSNNNAPAFDHPDLTPSHQAAQQQKQHQQRLMQQQQLQMKQQYVQQPSINRQSSAALMEDHHLQHNAPRHTQQHAAYPPNHQQQIQLQLHQQQQQQMLMRQQQQQQQIIMQQHRQSMDASIPMPRQVSKQAIVTASDHAMMKHPNIIRGHPQQQPLKYMPLNEPMNGQPIPQHLIGVPPHMINQMGPVSSGALPQHRRPGPNPHPQQQQASQQYRQQPPMQGYNSHPMNGAVPKHPATQAAQMQQAPHMMQHPDQLHAQQRLQMRPNTMAGQPMQPVSQQGPRRMFRAMYDYMANDVDEVSFFEHDIIVDCVNVDRNWLIGKVARTGATGMLPANYVEPIPSQ